MVSHAICYECVLKTMDKITQINGISKMVNNRNKYFALLIHSEYRTIIINHRNIEIPSNL